MWYTHGWQESDPCYQKVTLQNIRKWHIVEYAWTQNDVLVLEYDDDEEDEDSYGRRR